MKMLRQSFRRNKQGRAERLWSIKRPSKSPDSHDPDSTSSVRLCRGLCLVGRAPAPD